jgi:diguanylate cyclase (GGDEF)-like protein
MISLSRRSTNRQVRFLLMHQDEQFLKSRLTQFVAPFAPFAMVGAGTLMAITIALHWIRQTPNLGLLTVLLGMACLVSYALAPALGWSARTARGDVACLIGCVYIGTLAILITIAFSHGTADLSGSLSFIVILAIAPVIFWIKPWHYALGFVCAFAPSMIAMFVLETPDAHWSLLLMVCVVAAFVGSLGLYVISACLYIIYDQNLALHEISQSDDLTGLLRRRYWSDVSSQLLNRLAMISQPATLMYFDLDDFKCINDSFGHGVGDEALRMTADILVSSLPANAVTGRPGGDEFVSLLPNTRAHDATHIARLFRERLAAADEPARAMNASIGIAEWVPGEALDELVNRADKSMLGEKALNRLRSRGLLSAAS